MSAPSLIPVAGQMPSCPCYKGFLLDFQEFPSPEKSSTFCYSPAGTPPVCLPHPTLTPGAGHLLVGLSLVLNDHVFLMDRFQQGSCQGLQVRDGLRGGGEAAPVVLGQQILD